MKAESSQKQKARVRAEKIDMYVAIPAEPLFIVASPDPLPSKATTLRKTA